MVLPVDPAVGRFDKAVLIDARVGGEGVDEADVGTFGSLDGAHAAVVGIVNVADFEGRAVAVQAAGAESGKPALMGQLRKGVGTGR